MSRSSKHLSYINGNEEVQLFKLTFLPKERKDKKELSGRFFIYKHPEYEKVYVALTIEPTIFFHRGLLPFLQGLYPKVVLTFITHKRLRKLLEDFKTNYHFTDLIITRASYRLRFVEEGKHKKIVPVVSWPDMDLKEAFDWVYQNNGWFQSLQFDAVKDHLISTQVSFTRQGVVRTTRFFPNVFEAFILPVCKTIHDNIKIFQNRSRREYEDLAAKPLVIDFGFELFTEISENEKFIRAMKGFTTASISVLHGNPYIHMSIIDYLDGSTFDLWVLSSTKIIIVPQMKGSFPAIKRLVNHIFDNYAEGSIKDYNESMR